MIDKDFWRGKRVFLTGHTGFKGSWLSLWLYSLGAEVKGYALQPPTSPSLFIEAQIGSLIGSQFADIRDQETLHESMVEFSPDILIHMAAQSLVRYSYEAPIETYEVNVIGTAKVLEVARSCPNLKAIINITTDKCYENDERSEGYREDDRMGGYDPYSSSKGCAELITSAYRRSFMQEQGIGLASVRAGNVIGGGDWANDRLIPDILKSFEKNEPAVIRNPKAVRPWQHVLEPLSGYLILLQNLCEDQKKYAESWNFGPNKHDVRPVDWILEVMMSRWPNSSWKLDGQLSPHEAGFLNLDILKAQSQLGWNPVWKLSDTLEKIISWQQAWIGHEDMQARCFAEISQYTRDMNK
jgi:CDP-glucose 4,6-dehydratase